MTDRERLLEQVGKSEKLAGTIGMRAKGCLLVNKRSELARKAAHHALTALALRDVVLQLDAIEEREGIALDWGWGW